MRYERQLPPHLLHQAIARGAFGATLLARPRLALGVLGAASSDKARWGARLLGARHIVQALLVGRPASRGVVRAGAAVDAAHAVSMAVVAVASPRHRRVCLTNAVTAALLSATSLAATAARDGG